MTIDEHILSALATGGGRSLSIGDLARQLGISPQIVLPAARRLIEDGRANPSYVDVHGVPTLRGLAPLPASTTSTE